MIDNILSPSNEKFRVRLTFNKFPGGLFEFACCLVNLAQISPPTRQFSENQASVLIKLVLNVQQANNKERGSPTSGQQTQLKLTSSSDDQKSSKGFQSLGVSCYFGLQADSGKKAPEAQCQELKWRITVPVG